MYGIGIILIIAIIAVAIVLTRRSKKAFHSDSGTEEVSVPRRVWLYLITIISLGIFSAGVGQLLTLLFDITIKGSYLTQIGRDTFNQQQLSLGLAMMVIGGPLWFFFWRAIQRRVRENQVEIGSAIRKFYLNLIMLVTAFMGIIAASNFLRWLIAGVSAAEFSSSVLSMMIVSGILWFYHWLVSEGEGHPSSAAKTIRRWYIYVLAAFGLAWLAAGLVQLVNNAIINLPVWGSVLVRAHFWNNHTQISIAMMLFGGGSWYFHWFRMAKGDFDSTLRQVYFYLLTISGGAITALVVSTIFLFRFFLWVFGGAPVSVSPHFQFLGWVIPTTIVGVAIWGYHQRLAQEEAGSALEKRQSAQRIYFYLMSFLGLGTLVAGLCWLFGILIDFIINAINAPLAVSAGWWRNQLALCLALLIVGTPIWLYYWNRVLRRIQTGAMAEWRALSRRIFLYAVVGISIIALVADMVNIIYQLLSGALQGNFGVNILRNSKWSLQTLIVAAPLLWYHWQLLRTDQKRGIELVVARKDVTLLLDNPASDVARRIEESLGYKIHVLYQVGQKSEVPHLLPDEEFEKFVNEIQTAPSKKILLVITNGNVNILPYQDK